MTCMGIYGSTVDIAYLMLYISASSTFRYAKLDISLTPRIMYYMDSEIFSGTTNILRYSLITSSTGVYFAGDAKNIKSTTPHTYTSSVGFIMSYSTSSCCFSFSTAFTNSA